MGQKGTKYMILKVDVETGDVLPPENENGDPVPMASFEDMQKIYKSERGFKHVGTILHAHSSPGCVYYVIGGWVYRYCT